MADRPALKIVSLVHDPFSAGPPEVFSRRIATFRLGRGSNSRFPPHPTIWGRPSTVQSGTAFVREETQDTVPRLFSESIEMFRRLCSTERRTGFRPLTRHCVVVVYPLRSNERENVSSWTLACSSVS